MTLLSLTESHPFKPQASQGKHNGDYICWSRMQAEAGQRLEAIIERKERERSAGKGLFMWGVGNAPSTAINALARTGLPVPVVFSVMKAKAKAIDSAPTRTVVWRRYIDASGIERFLPSGALVTSRGDSPRGAKRRHYALMCYSEVPLRLHRGIPFDPSAYRNVGGAGAPAGASQVTVLLHRVAEPAANTEYEANIAAQLAGSYWVRLTDPAELDAAAIKAIENFRGSQQDWVRFVEDIRSTINPSCVVAETQPLLV